MVKLNSRKLIPAKYLLKPNSRKLIPAKCPEKKFAKINSRENFFPYGIRALTLQKTILYISTPLLCIQHFIFHRQTFWFCLGKKIDDSSNFCDVCLLSFVDVILKSYIRLDAKLFSSIMSLIFIFSFKMLHQTFINLKWFWNFDEISVSCLMFRIVIFFCFSRPRTLFEPPVYQLSQISILAPVK